MQSYIFHQFQNFFSSPAKVENLLSHYEHVVCYFGLFLLLQERRMRFMSILEAIFNGVRGSACTSVQQRAHSPDSNDN